MPDPAWPSSPPEVNHLRLAGPGAAGTATTLASGAAWQALMGSNQIAVAVSTLNTATTALNFEGVGGTSSMSSATSLNTALQLLAGWAQTKPPITASAVSAYETAVSAMIPAEVALANRAEQAADVALNPLVLGALTPAIVALDLLYFGEYWPQNASAGTAYAAALAGLAAALAVPPPLSPPGGSPAGVTAALAQTAGHATSEAMLQSAQLTDGLSAPVQSGGEVAATATSSLASATAQPLQAAMGAVQPVSGMFGSPLQGLGGIAGLSPSMFSALPGLPGPLSDGGGEMPLMLGSPAAGLGSGVPGGTAVAPPTGVAGVGSPGTGLTSYSRPGSTVAPENSGRPAALRTGLLSAAELRGPTTASTAPMGGAAIPVAPAQSGMLGRAKGADETAETKAQARVLVGKRPPG